MAILLKGERLPKRCIDCPFDWEVVTPMGNHTCTASEGINFIDGTDAAEGRQENCPLIYIPDDHGRLIDVDKLLKLMDATPPTGFSMAAAMNFMKLNLKQAETVIERGEEYKP